MGDQVAHGCCHNRINMTAGSRQVQMARTLSQSAINRAENQLRRQTYGETVQDSPHTLDPQRKRTIFYL